MLWTRRGEWVAKGFQGNQTADDEVKAVGRLAGFNDEFAWLEGGVHGAFGQNMPVAFPHAMEKGMVRQRIGGKADFALGAVRVSFMFLSLRMAI
jgi:hypothetical protein